MTGAQYSLVVHKAGSMLAKRVDSARGRIHSLLLSDNPVSIPDVRSCAKLFSLKIISRSVEKTLFSSCSLVVSSESTPLFTPRPYFVLDDS